MTENEAVNNAPFNKNGSIHSLNHVTPEHMSSPATDFKLMEDGKCVNRLQIELLKNLYTCSVCNFSTHKKKKIQIHWTTHENKKFQCEVCKKLFTKMAVLKRHELEHTNRKYYLCDLCGRSYLHSISLKYHRMSHLQYNPIAGERTKRIQEIDREIENRKEKPRTFLCDLCGKVFKQAVSLKTHKKKHEKDSWKAGDKHLVDLHKENFLLSDFGYEDYLNRKRPGPKKKNPLVARMKRFKCSECPYAAMRSRDVVVHLRTHTGEKPFQCNICGKFFSKESVVERHKLTHGVQNMKVTGKSKDTTNISGTNIETKSIEKIKNMTSLNCEKTRDIVSVSENVSENIPVKTSLVSEDKGTTSVKREMDIEEEIRLKYVEKHSGVKQCKFEEETKKLDAVSGEIWIPNVFAINTSQNCSDPKMSIQNRGFGTCKYFDKNIRNGKNCFPQRRELNRDDALIRSLYGHVTETAANKQPSDNEDLNTITSDSTLKENRHFAPASAVVNHSQINVESPCYDNTGRIPHVIRLDGKEINKEKRNIVSKEKKDKVRNVKGVRTKHKCEECPYETYLSRDLRVHKRKHSGERPFPCPICGKRFSKESVVKRHQSVHTGLRPYVCEFCFKSFSQQSNLKTHKIIHFDISTGLLKDNIETSKLQKKSAQRKGHEIYSFHTSIIPNEIELEKQLKNFDNDARNKKERKKRRKQHSVSVDETKLQNELKFQLKTKCVSSEEEGLKKQNKIDNVSLDETNLQNELKFQVKTECSYSDKECLWRQNDINSVSVNKTMLQNELKFQVKTECFYSDKECLRRQNDINSVSVNKTMLQNELKFQVKTECSSSDEECLSKIKEAILKTSSEVKVDHTLDPIHVDATNDIDIDWQNEDHFDSIMKDEYKENEDNCGNIVPHNKSDCAESLVKVDMDLEKKKLKKLKKKKNKKNQCYVDLLEFSKFIPQQISRGGKVLFKCDSCHYAVVSKRDLTVHRRSHSGEKLFTCDICMKTFSKQSVVNRHKLIHFGVRPFTCHLCGLTFTQSNSLKKHLAIKHGVEEKDLPFKCDLCLATFAQEKSLKTHKHVHLRKKNNAFTCHICGKVFPHECRLKSHLLLHDERQFTCQICSKKFLRKYDLKYHLSIHTQEKKSVCHICGGIFSTPATFKIHLRSHSLPTVVAEKSSETKEVVEDAHKGGKSLQCHICMEYFSQVSKLRKHQQTHSSWKPYQCAVCLKHFKLLGHLHKHYHSTQHDTVKPEEYSQATS